MISNKVGSKNVELEYRMYENDTSRTVKNFRAYNRFLTTKPTSSGNRKMMVPTKELDGSLWSNNDLDSRRLDETDFRRSNDDDNDKMHQNITNFLGWSVQKETIANPEAKRNGEHDDSPLSSDKCRLFSSQKNDEYEIIYTCILYNFIHGDGVIKCDIL